MQSWEVGVREEHLKAAPAFTPLLRPYIINPESRPLSQLQNRAAVESVRQFEPYTSQQQTTEDPLQQTWNPAEQQEKRESIYFQRTRAACRHDFRQVEKVWHRLRLSGGGQSSGIQQWRRGVRTGRAGPVWGEPSGLPEAPRRRIR